MGDDPSVIDLVARARDGEQWAWDEIIERYAPLVWSVCRRHGIDGADADDVGANTWLRLVEHLSTLREAAALPGWLATTTQRECLQLFRRTNRLVPTDQPSATVDVSESDDMDRWLLLEERRIALRDAFDQLSERCRALLGLLFADPPHPYAEICDSLGIAVGAVGPMRQRCLERLRRSRSLRAFDEPGSRVNAGEHGG